MMLRGTTSGVILTNSRISRRKLKSALVCQCSIWVLSGQRAWGNNIVFVSRPLQGCVVLAQLKLTVTGQFKWEICIPVSSMYEVRYIHFSNIQWFLSLPECQASPSFTYHSCTSENIHSPLYFWQTSLYRTWHLLPVTLSLNYRSEERRVGKECSS